MNGSKKVLYLITKSEPFGGAQRYVFDLATSLPKERFEVVVGAGGGGLLIRKLNDSGIRTVSIPSLGRDVRFLADIRSFFEVFTIIQREKPDILHLNSSKIGALGALAGRLCGVQKIIFTAHGWAFEEDRAWISRTIIKVISWFTILFAHETIAISYVMRGEMLRLPGTRNVHVIHNGVAPFEIKSRERAREFLVDKNVQTDGPVVGTIAELHPIKGLAYAVEAVKILRDSGTKVSFVIFGGGSERTKLETTVQKCGLSDSVYLLGFVPDARQYLSGLDMFVLPSLYEGLSFAILEAGSAHLPVVASRVGGIPEIIQDHESGLLVTPRDPQAIAAAIQSLLADKELQKNLGEKLCARVQAEFSHQKMTDETVRLYVQ